MLYIFILIVSNHRKFGYYVICRPSICKYRLHLILLQCGIGLKVHNTSFYILTSLYWEGEGTMVTPQAS